MWIISASDSKRMDEVALNEFGVSVETLMENAGSAVFEAITRHVRPPASIAVICGPGHNGGDGIIAARMAHEAGFKVVAVFTSNMEDLAEETTKQVKAAMGKGVKVAFPTDTLYMTTLERLCAYHLIVDAILGTGQKGDLRGNVSAAVNAIRVSGTPVIAVDVPTGIETDTGKELGSSVWALETVVLGYPKRFLFQGRGLEHSGFWQVADIGLPKWSERRVDLFAMTVNPRGLPRVEKSEDIGFELPERTKTSHKGNNGHVLIVAGSRSMPGAAVLAANAALRSGAGLVSIASIQEVCDIVSSRLPECLTIPLPSDDDGCIAAESATLLKEKSEKFDSSVFGPGMTHNESVRQFLSDLWKDWEIPSCIDADALNAVAMGTELPSGPCILTPHPGEMARLLKTSTDAVEADRFWAVVGAANKFQRTVLLKGPYTLCADPSSEDVNLGVSVNHTISVNATGNPGMATGGMGDVLSGMIGTLLAQHLGNRAGIVAAHWHGEAGDICAREIGTVGYLPTDVCNALPTARAKLTSLCL